MSAFGTYLIGFFILVIGLGLAAYWLNAPPMWIGIGCLIMVGLGIILATQRTKTKDPPST
ncbi:MAG: hypothetical protein ABJD07_05010 [Gemmatimonadaceae bacterium]